MYGSFRTWLQVLWAQLLCGWVLGSELTFELPDNAKQCFYEDIIIGTKCTLEFQVNDLCLRCSQCVEFSKHSLTSMDIGLRQKTVITYKMRNVC